MGQKVRILKTDIDNLTQSEVVEEIGVLKEKSRTILRILICIIKLRFQLLLICI